jgi:hypothetical protein
MSRKRIARAQAFAQNVPPLPAMHPFISQKGQYVDWGFEPGMRYIIPLKNGPVVEGDLRRSFFIHGIRHYSLFVNTRIPGHPNVHDFIMLHPLPYEDEDISIEFEDEESGETFRFSLKAPPKSVANVEMEAEHRENQAFRNAYVFEKQANLPEELKNMVSDYIPKPHFGPLRKFGGRTRSKKKRKIGKTIK